MSESQPLPLAERRGLNDRRRYNRRSAPDPGSPPYYEVFERIAQALESIERSLRPEGQAAAEQPTTDQPAADQGTAGQATDRRGAGRTTARPRRSPES